MATRTRETERKYELPAGGTLPALDDLPGVTVASPPDDLSLDAVYHDTPDLRLAAAGITLRRRTGGSDAGWHLKLPAGKDSRDELRVPLGRTGKRVPRELAELVRAYSRGAGLIPVVHLRTARRRWTLLDADGNPAAEVASDDVSAQTLGESATLDSWREVEVELLGGDRDLLDTVGARLRGAGVLPSDGRPKLVRLLGNRVPVAPARSAPNRRSTAGQVVLADLRTQVARIKREDPRVRQDEPDSVHSMRVATRRLRSTLQAYGSVVARKHTRMLTEELRWLAGVLGQARDLEVLERRFVDAVAELPDELVLGNVRARLVEHFAGRAASARADVLAALDGPRYLALLDALDELLANPPLTPLAEGRAAGVLPELAGRAWRTLARATAATDGLDQGHELDRALHEVRKKAKRFRYTAESAVPVLGKGPKRSARRAKALQRLLGDHQDSVLARGELRQLAVETHLSGDNSFTFGLLHEREHNRADDAEAAFPSAWRAAAKRGQLRWLA
ncbi:CYTH and CHAD domain-containing protein [Solihabitans fulvus]|uniref:CYTH and CHAD domain-containing protein n=1 Tax=Solihabitans fulvus TaxID=1892852 RepID=A0A5B2X487_9PSEU|nr:CYTH and CHAD domain-containing protein [Solihabitans fulvus]KAA2258128.1 CYTH and CHAD domain-containing protein [Solihabitans fulvus]